jgi:hypothetical protein
MKAFRSAWLGLALIASLTSMGGYDTNGSKASPSRAPSSAALGRPLDTISGPLRDMIATRYQFTIKTQDVSFYGAVDRASNSAEWSLVSSAPALNPSSSPEDTTTDVVALGTDLYVRAKSFEASTRFGLDGRNWTRLDGTKVTSLAQLGVDDPHDPLDYGGLDKALVTVEQTGDRTYRGTLDLSAIPAATQDPMPFR